MFISTVFSRETLVAAHGFEGGTAGRESARPDCAEKFAPALKTHATPARSAHGNATLNMERSK